MILGGDEIGRTQLGNNNAYNQDNQTSWYDWDLDDHRSDFLAFASRLIAIRQRHPNLRRRAFLDGVLPREGEPTPLSLAARGQRRDDRERVGGTLVSLFWPVARR